MTAIWYGEDGITYKSKHGYIGSKEECEQFEESLKEFIVWK